MKVLTKLGHPQQLRNLRLLLRLRSRVENSCMPPSCAYLWISKTRARLIGIPFNADIPVFRQAVVFSNYRPNCPKTCPELRVQEAIFQISDRAGGLSHYIICFIESCRGFGYLKPLIELWAPFGHPAEPNAYLASEPEAKPRPKTCNFTWRVRASQECL